MIKKIAVSAILVIANVMCVGLTTRAATSYCIKGSTGGSAATWFQSEAKPNNPSYSAIDISTWQGMTHAQKVSGGPYYLTPVPSGGCESLNSYEPSSTTSTSTSTTTSPSTTSSTSTTTSTINFGGTMTSTTSSTSTTVVQSSTTVSSNGTSTTIKDAQAYCSVTGFFNSKSQLTMYEALKNVTNHKSGAYSDISGWNCITNRFKHLTIEDKDGLSTQASLRFDVYFSPLVSNCWRVKHVYESGEGEWSNQVCYLAPAIATSTTVASGVVRIQQPPVVRVEYVPSGITGAQCFDGFRTKNTTSGACGNHGGRDQWLFTSFVQGYNKSYRRSTSSNSNGVGSSCVGICYGVPSKVNGLPRNSYVNGYYRSDGTYVRPYTRSKP